MSLLPDSDFFILPLTRDSADDAVITRGDLRNVGASDHFTRLGAIAAALTEKRRTMLAAAGGNDAGEAGMDCTADGQPGMTLFIDAEDLARHESLPRWGNALHEAMREICGDGFATPEARRRTAARVKVPLAGFNAVLRQKTGGRFAAGFRAGRIMIIDDEAKSFTLFVGEKGCDLTRSFGSARGAHRMRLAQLAAAGVNGVALSELNPPLTGGIMVTKIRLSQMNRVLRDGGAGTLGLSCYGGRVYLFDHSQKKHRAAYERLRLHEGRRRRYTQAALAAMAPG